MSTTKRPMLSYTHAIFRGLQDDLRTSLRELPLSTPSVLRNGLLEIVSERTDFPVTRPLQPADSNGGPKKSHAREVPGHVLVRLLGLESYMVVGMPTMTQGGREGKAARKWR
ncbi:hypothetical protein B0H14DRAFT_3540856 [Mycena olivaceomarginata]|nr:hypothetical protein B0H14DRAFT_3540856 [Mycena olivaceomarginata]